MMRLGEVVRFLDDLLQIHQMPDYRDAYNGLQVEGRDEVQRVALAVDACQATLHAAVQDRADLLVVHHGLFWGPKAPITGLTYRRLSTLLQHDLALYSAHLPLDAHPTLGNNARLLQALGLTPAGRLGEFERSPVGFWAETDLAREELHQRLTAALGAEPRMLPLGPARVRKVGVVSGGAGSWIDQAARAGCDAYITGEGAHHTYFEAEERGINVWYGGHYLTERLGVLAVGEVLQGLGLDTFFLEHPTGL